MRIPSLAGLRLYVRRALALGVILVCVLACAAVLAWVFSTVEREAGAIAAVVVTVTIVALVFAGLNSLRWLRGARLLITAALGAAGTLLTLVLGYRLEHPSVSESDERFTGWVLVATLIAFVASVTADVRLRRLEEHERSVQVQRDIDTLHAQHLAALERERRAELRHAELMSELARLRSAETGVPRSGAGLAIDRFLHRARPGTSPHGRWLDRR